MDVPYINHQTGEERLLPEGMGEAMGFERVQGYTPPEVSEPAQIDDKQPGGDAKAELEHAVTTVFGYASNGVDALGADEKEKLTQLADNLYMFGFNPDEERYNDQHKTAPSLSDAVDLVIAHLSEGYENLNDEVAAQVDRLMDRLTVMYGDEVEGQEEQTAGPSFEDARKLIEDAVIGDPDLSDSQKRTFRTHLNTLGGQRITGTETHSPVNDTPVGGSVPAPPVADPASQSTTEPKDQEQPGKSA